MARVNQEDLGRLAQDLKPYLAGWFGYREAAAVAASGSGSLEPHALNSTYHTGILGYDQAPWAVTDDEFASHIADPNAHHYMATQGNGITINGLAQAVSVRTAATSGLSFDGTGGLQVDDAIAGSALVMASKILSVNVATNGGIAISSDALTINLATPSGLQLVTNQLALADSIAGNGLTIASKVLAINLGSPSGLELVADALQVADSLAGNGLTMSAKVMAINLATPSGLEIVTDALQLSDTIAGAGLGISAKILSVNAGVGLAISGDNVILGTPSTLNVTSTNVASGTTHQHQIDHRSNPGQASYILSTDANGELFLYRETVSNRLQTPLINTAAGQNLLLQPTQYLDLDPDGALVRMLPGTSLQTDNYFSQTTGMRVSYLGEGDFRYIYTDELHAKAFIADLEQALAGGQIISKSVAVLAAPFTAPSPVSVTPTITFRADAHARTTGTTLTVTKPAGTVEGDVMVALLAYYSALTINSAPAGWTLLTTQTGGTDAGIKVYYKVAGASEPANYAWTISAGDDFVGIISTFYNVNTTTPINAYGGQGGTSTTTLTAPSITTTVANTHLVYLAGFNDANVTGASATAPSGMTETDDYAGTLYSWGYVAGVAQAAAGATGTKAATLASAHQYAAVLLALNPLPAVAGTTTLIVEDLPSAPNMQVFEAGDYVRLREFSRAGGGLSITDCWGTVSNYVDGVTDVDGIGVGNQQWTFTRSVTPDSGAMAQGTVVQPGAIVLDYGTSGNGFYEVNAIDGIYALNSPYMQVVSWTGHPHSGKSVRLRAGNLRGVFGITNEYGLYAGNGNINPADTYMRLSTQALEFHNISSGWYNVSGTQTVAIDSGGTMWLGPSSIDKRLYFDGTNLQLKGGLIVGPGLGFSTDALFYAAYDGLSIRGDSSGNPNGHLGQQATISGAPRFRPGRYGKALEVSDAYTNMMGNPSFEADAVGAAPANWLNHVSGTATGTRAVTDEDSWDGAKCLKIAKTGGAVADQYGVYITWNATINVYYSMSVRVRLSNLVGATSNIANLASSTSLSVVSATYNTAGEWVELRITARATATASARINLYIANCATGVMYVDAAMLYAGTTSSAFYPPYWEAYGARTLSSVRYNATGIGNITNDTICGWFYLNDSASAVGRELILFDLLQPDTNSNNRLLGYVSATNKLGISFYLGGVLTSLVGTVDVTAGAWHHFAYTVNGTSLTLYLDGAVAATGTATGYLINTDVLSVGAYLGGATMNGLMDDFAVIPRALSASEILQIYSNGNPLRPMSSPYEMQIWNRDSAGSLSKIAATGKGMFGSTINNTGVETVNFGFFNDTVASWGGFTSLAAGDVVIGRSAGNYIRYTNSTGLLTMKGAIQIVSGSSGIGSFSDANLDNIANGATYARTTFNEVTGANRAYTTIDATGTVITKIDPSATWGANPGAGLAGLLLGGDYMGYWSGSVWKTYMDNAGRFYLNNGSASNYLSWDNSTLTVNGTIYVQGAPAASYNNVTGAINLVRNSSFELDSNNDGIADYFSIYNNDGAAVPTSGQIVTNAERSTKAQRSIWTGTNATTKGIYFSVGTHKAGVPYVVTFWCRASTTVQMALAHNIVPTKVNLNWPTANGTWQFFAVKCTWATDNTDGIYITINPGAAIANGWVDFDNVMIYEGDQIVPYQPAPTDIIGYGGVLNMPAAPGAGTSGLYATSTNLGYWDGSKWNVYISSGGQFYFGGASGASLRWDGSTLTGYDSGNTAQWSAGSTNGRITFGNNKGTLGTAGLSLLAASTFSTGDASNLSFYSTLPATGLVAEVGAAAGGFNNLNIRSYNNGTTAGPRTLIGTVVNGVYGAYAQATSSYVGGVWNHGWEFYGNLIFWNTATLYGPTTIANTLSVTSTASIGSSLTVTGAGTFGDYAVIGTSIGAGYYQDAVNGAFRARVGSGTTNGYYYQTNGGGTTVLYIGLGGTYLGRIGINRLDPAYSFDVSGEGRITGTMRVEVALSMLPQGSPPGVSAAYGILYVNASNQLCYIKKNGTSPGTVIVA